MFLSGCICKGLAKTGGLAWANVHSNSTMTTGHLQIYGQFAADVSCCDMHLSYLNAILTFCQVKGATIGSHLGFHGV